MEKHIYNEKNGLSYTLGEDGFYYPDLALPAEEELVTFGKYGRMRLRFLQEHHRVVYINLLTAGKLHRHLQKVDAEATQCVETLIVAMAKAEGTDEEFKANHQMEWVGRMNNYKSCAEEVVLAEQIYL